MMHDSKLVAFTATTDADRARTFYRDTLGLTLREETPFALVFDVRGTELRVQRVHELTPPQFTTLGWAVDDIRAAIRDLTARGVEFARFPGLEQDELGVWTAPGGARIAWFRDPDGNILSLAQQRRE